MQLLEGEYHNRLMAFQVNHHHDITMRSEAQLAVETKIIMSSHD